MRRRFRLSYLYVLIGALLLLACFLLLYPVRDTEGFGTQLRINVGSNLTSASFLSGDPVSNTRLTLTMDTTTTPNGVDLVVGGTGPANLNWNGPGTTAVWDLKTTANFTGGPADNQFFNLDNVSFTAGASTVTVTGTGTLALRPGSVTVNSAQSYTFSGTGVLTAATGTLRMISESHYFTDVLAGAAIGASTGVLIPLLHRRGSALGGNAVPSVATSPGGATFGMTGTF